MLRESIQVLKQLSWNSKQSLLLLCVSSSCMVGTREGVHSLSQGVTLQFSSRRHDAGPVSEILDSGRTKVFGCVSCDYECLWRGIRQQR